MFDWSTGLTGLRVGAISDLAGLYIAEKTRLRNAEEQKRLLYVAMTRARENLIISCAPRSRRSSGSFLSMLDGTLSDSIHNAEASKPVNVGNGTVEIEVVSASLTAPSGATGKSKLAKKELNWQSFIDTWTRRTASYEKAQQYASFLTPTLLKGQEEASTEAGSKFNGASYRHTPALVVGDLAHRFLQQWKFGGVTNNFEAQLRDFIGRALPREFASSHREIESDLQDIFRGFFGSKAYADLASARILGREVPLLMPWDGRIMEGVIDVIYERDRLLYLADYKTDRISRNELSQGADRYRQQAEVYTRAAVQGLRREVAAFKVIFLRLGAAVEVRSSGKQEELFTE
jgi:ATP-dependent helicase/nuclease subunit A